MLCEQKGLTHGPNPASISSCSVAKNNHMNFQTIHGRDNIVVSELIMVRCVHTYMHI